MSEHGSIANTPLPRTRASLAADFRRLGIAQGNIVLVHASLSRIGWVAGGPVAVIEALGDAIGDSGTLVMPAHSADWTDPARWQAPPVPADWIELIRAEMPAFDPERTPTRNMGRIAELFRSWPEVRRSDHPACSFAARGPLAETILADHALESPLGEGSPLARLYDLDAHILLLGVGLERCTMLHLAEQRAWPGRRSHVEGAAMLVDGRRQWVFYRTPPLVDADHFPSLSTSLQAANLVRTGMAGSAPCLLLPARTLVDFAVDAWSGMPLPE